MKNVIVLLFSFFFPLSGITANLSDEKENLDIVAGPLATYLSEFSLSEKPLVYNKRGGFSTYFYSIPIAQMDTDVERTIHFRVRDSSCLVTIDNKVVLDQTDFTFINVTARKTYTLKVLSQGKVLVAVSLTFTGLPVVEIEYNLIDRDIYYPGFIKVHEPAGSTIPEKMNIDMQFRGSNNLGKPKRSFNVKLKDKDGEAMDKSFLGLRKDNKWILDAMVIDPSRMRNRVATDLWNDFSTLPYHTTIEKGVINGTRGNYVELFINNVYNGLYCMTEKVDRKQLKLKKYIDSTQTIRGVIYKSVGWSYSSFWGHNYADGDVYPGILPVFSSNNSESWDGYEIKYPDMDDHEEIDWTSLYNAVSFNATSAIDSIRFVTNYKSYFDMPVWLDYYLLIDLLLATDNHGKNCFVSTYDKNISTVMSITPWDMDGTFGRDWSGAVSWGNNMNSFNAAPNQDFDNFLIRCAHGQHGVYRNLKRFNPDNFKENLRQRYLKLRKSYFTHESLMARFVKYKMIFDKSGAGDRETRLWNGNLVTIDFTAEMEYLSTWIRQRLAYMDETEYAPYCIDNNPEVKETLQPLVFPNPVSSILTISQLSLGNVVQLFDSFGRIIYTGVAGETMLTIDLSHESSGFYYLKAGEMRCVIVKQ